MTEAPENPPKRKETTLPDPKETENDPQDSDRNLVGVERPHTTDLLGSQGDAETLRRVLLDLLKRRRKE